MRQKVVAIDPDRSSLKSIANLNGSIEILSVHRRRQSVKRIVRLLEDIGDILEFGDGDDRSEDFFLHNLHLRGDVGEDCGFDEITFLAVTFTAESDFRTLVLARLDVVHDTGELEFGDLRALDGIAFEWVSDDVFLCAGSKFLDEFVVDLFLDVNTRSSTATLTCCQQHLVKAYHG